MKYLLLVLLPGFVTTIQEIFPRLIPANLRQGNRYNIEVDNIGSQIIYKGVAVFTASSKAFYGELDENNDCTTFALLNTVHQACKYRFLLLQGNDRYYQRYLMTDWLNNNLGCTPIGADDHVLIFIKHDVMNPRSEKFIGTYSRNKDMVMYIGHSNKRVVRRRASKLLASGSLSKQMFEVVCELDFNTVPLEERANKAFSN